MVGPSPEAEAAGDIKGGGDNAGDEKRRRLIVDLDPPRFARFTGLLDVPGTLLGWGGDRYGGSNPLGELVAGGGGRGVGGGGAAARELEETFRTALNEDQRAAVRKLVTAKDYALMLGMPGTGVVTGVREGREEVVGGGGGGGGRWWWWCCCCCCWVVGVDGGDGWVVVASMGGIVVRRKNSYV